MINELTYDVYSLGILPAEGEAKGHYLVRQWTQDGDFLYYAPTTNRAYEIEN